MSDEPSEPPSDAPIAFDAAALWGILVSVSEAAVALQKARDTTLATGGHTLAASTLYVLAEAATALSHEIGREFTLLRSAPDAATRQFVTLVLDRLARSPSITVPPAERDEDEAADGG